MESMFGVGMSLQPWHRQVAVAQVVGDDEDDVRAARGSAAWRAVPRGRRERRRGGQERRAGGGKDDERGRDTQKRLRHALFDRHERPGAEVGV